MGPNNSYITRYKDRNKIDFVAPTNNMGEGAELLQSYLRWTK